MYLDIPTTYYQIKHFLHRCQSFQGNVPGFRKSNLVWVPNMFACLVLFSWTCERIISDRKKFSLWFSETDFKWRISSYCFCYIHFIFTKSAARTRWFCLSGFPLSSLEMKRLGRCFLKSISITVSMGLKSLR